MAKSKYDRLLESLQEDPPETRENKYFHYGFYEAYYTQGLLSLSELQDLQRRLGLTDDEVDELVMP